MKDTKIREGGRVQTCNLTNQWKGLSLAFSEQVDSHDSSYGRNGPVDPSVPLRESSLKSSKGNIKMLFKTCGALKIDILLKKDSHQPQNGKKKKKDFFRERDSSPK